MTLSYRANTYSWYVNMYIGLFLFIPFLNMVGSSLWKLHSKKIFFALFASLFFVTTVPSFLRSIFISGQRLEIFPSYWESIYPVFYYFIGFFLNKMADTIKIRKIYLVLSLVMLIGVESLSSLFIFREHYNGLFSWDIFEGYGSFFTILASILFFLLIYNIKIKNSFLVKLFYTISKHSFNIYLFSKIYDLIFYPYFINKYFVTQPQFLPFYFVIVPLVFICSYLSSVILEMIFAQMDKSIFWIKKKMHGKELCQ